jgi:hypothetical protein
MDSMRSKRLDVNLLRRARERFNYANVMATIAVFLALGGGAVAAKTLKLKKNSVTSSKIAPDAVKGIDAKESTFGQVPTAARANTANSADNAAKLGGEDPGSFERRRVRISNPDIAGGDPVDLTPDVTGLSVLVLDHNVPTVLSEGSTAFTGGVEGQRLTVVSGDQNIIITDTATTQVAAAASWSGTANDSITFVLADGIWYETSRSDN